MKSLHSLLIMTNGALRCIGKGSDSHTRSPGFNPCFVLTSLDPSFNPIPLMK